jgi:hypothetical protein
MKERLTTHETKRANVAKEFGEPSHVNPKLVQIGESWGRHWAVMAATVTVEVAVVRQMYF